jgi:peptidoglycan/LPS O-acetylase OafA/YrhL
MSGRLRSLDGLRALAVLLVFVHHVDQHALPGGLLGVELFFALSG